MTATQTLDIEKAQQLGMKLIGDTTGALIGVLTVVGDRLGLFDALAAAGPLTSDGFARSAGIAERYAREWLSAMACHGYVTYDDATKTFSLTPEQAFCLVDRDSPLYLTSIFGVLPDYWRNLDLLTDAFQHGGGVPQERFGDEWLCGFQRFSRTAFVNYLCQDWIPAMPEIDARLRAGGSVADVGCGNGLALIQLAKRLPRSPAGRLRPPRPGDRGGAGQRRGGRRRRPDPLRGPRRRPGHPRQLRPDHLLRRRPRHALPAPGAAPDPRGAGAGRQLLRPGVQLLRRPPGEHRPPLRHRGLRLRRQRQLLHDHGAGRRRRRDGHLHGRAPPPRVRRPRPASPRSAGSTSRRTRST